MDQGADLGFAFDGDADRVLAVDRQGRAVDGDHILYLWGQHLHQRDQLPQQMIVTTVMANLGFERAWQRQGGAFIRTAVGDQHVQAAMEQEGAMLGGEQSGHVLCRHYGLTGDGLLTALHLAQLVQETQTPLAQLVDSSFQPYPQLLRNVRVTDRQKRADWQNCEPLAQAIELAQGAMGDRGRILVRASGTEPVIRVMVEAAEASLVDHWTEQLVGIVATHLGD
jgi:phosphoglucosamine mutase